MLMVGDGCKWQLMVINVSLKFSAVDDSISQVVDGSLWVVIS